MKILVLGSTGMAGHVIVKYLKMRGYNVVSASRNKDDIYINVEDKSLIPFCINKNHCYDFVINCIGLLVKDSNNDPCRAITVNSWFPHYLEFLLKDSKTRLIHLSTDCVFSGQKGDYVESDTPDETNFYGKSKSLGEVNNEKDVTFRTSIIGPELKNNGTGLLHWVLSSKEMILPGWENAYWNGITTLQLAKCIETHMHNPIISGIYHLVSNDNKINKYGLLRLINETYGLNKQIEKTVVPKSINKVLIDTRKIVDFNIPSYNVMLQELRDFI